MTSAFVFVTTRSLRNRVLVRLRRLRQPRYLVSFLAGLGYMWFVFFRRTHNSAAASAVLYGRVHFGDLGRDLASVVILAIMLLVWALPSQYGGIEFSEAEIQFLFPAPVARRQLLLYKLMRGIPQMLFTVAIMTFFGFRQALGIGLLAAFAAQNAYFMMVAQARARLKLAGIGVIARAIAVLIVGIGLSWFLMSHVETGQIQSALKVANRTGTQPFLNAADASFQKPAVSVLLFVPHLFASAAFPGSISQLAISCVALLILGYCCFLVAAKLNVSFEEASVLVSQKRTERRLQLNSRRSGRWIPLRRMPPPFRLGSRGPAEVAIIWKNLTAAMRISAPWLVIILVSVGILLFQAFASHSAAMHISAAMTALFFCALFPFVGTAMFQQDLRLDLPRIELLKGYPLSGERIVAAEIAAPLIIVSITELLLLTATAAMLQLGGVESAGKLRILANPEYITLAMLFATPICAAQLLIRNTTAIVLPAWSSRSKEEPRGIVMTGQRLVMLAGNLVVLCVALIPSMLILLLGLWISHRYFAGSPMGLALAASPAVALLCAEVYVGIKVLGGQFERIDVSNELDPANT
jgi:ABC-2 type transport system permease protein